MRVLLLLISLSYSFSANAQSEPQIEYSRIVYATTLNHFLSECPEECFTENKLLVEWTAILDSENQSVLKDKIELINKHGLRDKYKKRKKPFFLAHIEPMYFKNSSFNIDIMVYQFSYKKKNTFEYGASFGTRYQFEFDCKDNRLVFRRLIPLGL